MFRPPDTISIQERTVMGQQMVFVSNNSSNHEDAQRREKAFWMILSCESGFYCTRALWKEIELFEKKGLYHEGQTLSMTTG